MNIIIITGASSGMGKESARQVDKIYSDKIDELWLIARREEQLEHLSLFLNHKCRIIPMDLTNEEDLNDFELLINSIKPNVKMLINASGYGIIGRFDSSDIKDQTGMIRLNCESLVHITRLVLEHMHRGARIIQYSSSAAFVPQENFNVYSATKSFVLSFSQALNQELYSKGISVTAVCPGPVDTEFFNHAQKYNQISWYKKFFLADPVDVVWASLYDSYRRKSISIYSLPMKLLCIILKFIPHDLVLKILSKG